MPVVSVKAASMVRRQRLFKEVKTPDGVVRQPFFKTFLDVLVITGWSHHLVQRELFTGHVYRGELRIIVRATSKRDKDESMTLDDFTKYATRRWGTMAGTVLAELKPLQEGN